jgi:hypothetical protein
VHWLVIREILAFRELILAVLASAITLLSLAIFEHSAVLPFLLPSPERTAEEFVHALSDHRYRSAWNLLSRLGRRLISVPDLARLVHSLECARGGLTQIDAIDSRELSNTAQTRVVVRGADGACCIVNMSLKRENALWTVANLGIAVPETA